MLRRNEDRGQVRQNQRDMPAINATECTHIKDTNCERHLLGDDCRDNKAAKPWNIRGVHFTPNV